MKKVLLVTFGILLTSSLFAGSSTDKKIDKFFKQLQEGKYEEGLVDLLSDTALESKVITNIETKKDWIFQFTQIRNLYGKYLNYEKVKTITLGQIETTIYFFYCESYPIQIIMTEYNNGKKIDIINMVYDDQVLETLDTYGIIN